VILDVLVAATPHPEISVARFAVVALGEYALRGRKAVFNGALPLY